jgi:hypothetical protein
MDLSALSDFAKQHGFVALCLCALAAAVWAVVRWVGREVVKPIVTDFFGALFARLMKFIDTVEQLVRKQSEDVAELRASITRIELRQDEQLRTCSGPRVGASPA